MTYSTYVLGDDIEGQRAREWMNKQWTEKPRNDGIAGGRFTFCFTQTSVGLALVVKDNCTQEEIDVTNYESW